MPLTLAPSVCPLPNTSVVSQGWKRLIAAVRSVSTRSDDEQGRAVGGRYDAEDADWSGEISLQNGRLVLRVK